MSRTLLGAADVTDEQLCAMVAALIGAEHAELAGPVDVRTVDYDLPAITTGGRWWVSGEAATAAGRAPYRFFVKQVQSWERHPYFAHVPDEFREAALAGVPWRTEPEVYRSDVADRLPPGFSVPRALGVFDLDATSAAVWLEEVPHRAVTWDEERYERAAHLLGRLSGSRALAPLATLRDVPWALGVYAEGRVAAQLAPILESDDVWRHPLSAAFGTDLRDRLRAAARRAPELAAEADALPALLGHGDACPNNLLAGERDDEFTLIDFGFWGLAPVGFDLTQLLVGDVQLGRRGVDDLADLDESLVAAYVAGLRAEGCEVPDSVVRRAHALCLLVMAGLSALPFELFDAPPDAGTQRLAAARAAVARYALDLVDATS